MNSHARGDGIPSIRENRLPRHFYQRDTLIVARELLGKILVRRFEGELLSGRIVETEAYIGEDDPACHAARGLTPRTRPMFGPPGKAYVYFIYGMYYCLNAVTEREGFPAAVLIRALEPLGGIETMSARRGSPRPTNLTNGPGKLCQAMAIDKSLNETSLQGEDLYILDGPTLAAETIGSSPRIGIKVGTENPWRFFEKANPFVSK